MLKRLTILGLIILFILPLVSADCGKLFERFKDPNAECCPGLELQELPPDRYTGEIEYRCVKGQELKQKEEQEALGTMFIFLGIFLLFFLSFVIVYILAWIKFWELYKKETGKSFSLKYFPTAGLNIAIHLFHNEYKEDKYYNTLIWILRILLILIIIFMIIRAFD